MSDKATLLEFGFSESKATKALRITKNAGLQPALDWLANHAEDASGDEEEEEVADVEAGDEEGGPGGVAEAKVSTGCSETRTVADEEGESSPYGVSSATVSTSPPPSRTFELTVRCA